MTTTTTEHAARTEPITTAVIWNDAPFLLAEAVQRSTRIIRTKKVPLEMRRHYRRTGWPRHLIVNREHTLTLLGEDEELLIVTNAEEAEDELPEMIVTHMRETGTYRNAIAVWRGRPVKSFVSVRLLAQALPTPADHGQPAPFTPEVYLAIEEVLKGGIIVPHASMPEEITPDDRMLFNLLAAMPPGKKAGCLSLHQVAQILNVSDETVRRRRKALERAHPRLRSVIASFRSRGASRLGREDIMPSSHEDDPRDDD